MSTATLDEVRTPQAEGLPRRIYDMTINAWVMFDGGELVTDQYALWTLREHAASGRADDTGTPMHAVENARYWLGLTEFQTADVRGEDGGLVKADLPHKPYVMSHLRITEDEYATLVADLDAYREDPGALAADIAARWEGRWAQQSTDAVALLATYTDGGERRG